MLTFFLGALGFVVIVVLAYIALSVRAGAIMAYAMADMYDLLSFEPTLFEDVLQKATKTSSVHIKWYLRSRFVRHLFHDEIEKGEETEDLVYILLEHLQEWGSAEIVDEQCTAEWLETNMFRLRSLTEADRREVQEAAEAAKNDLVHTPELDTCAKCEKEEEVFWVTFVRKLPKGVRPPRLKMPRLWRSSPETVGGAA